MHQSYQALLKHPHDFVVAYRFFTPEEGGRISMPFQGVRLDFKYADTTLNIGGASMIWPEFEDKNGQVILDNTLPIASIGTARMWIINSARRAIHREIINIGIKAYFIEGEPVAECEVIEIAGLMSNPLIN